MHFNTSSEMLLNTLPETLLNYSAYSPLSIVRDFKKVAS